MNPLKLVEMPKEKDTSQHTVHQSNDWYSCKGFNSYHTELVALNADKKVVLDEEKLKELFDDLYADWDGVGIWHRYLAQALANNVDKFVRVE